MNDHPGGFCFSGPRQAVLSALWVCALFAPGVMAEDLGWFAAKRVHDQAETALERQDYAAAGELYGQLIEGLDRTKKRRGQALWGAAVAALSVEGGEAAAQGHLAELLDAFPRHEKRAEALLLQRLTAQRLEAQNAPAPPPEVSEPPPAEEAPEVSSTDDGRVKKLQARVARLERELREAREEVVKKEEAIEKLKQLVVGENG